MKNILMIDLGKQYGGAEKYIESVRETMADQCCFHVLVRKKSVFYSKMADEKINNICSISFEIKNIIKDLTKVKKYIKKNNIEVIHAHGINSEVFSVLLKNFVKNKKIIFVSTVHGIAEMDRMNESILKQKLFSFLQVFALKKFDSIIAVSYSIKDNLIAKKVNSNKIHVIYHFIDSAKINRDYVQHDTLKVCSVGRLEKVKNNELAIKAIANVSKKNKIKFDIYGVGSLKQELIVLINELGMEKIVTLKGYRNNIEEVYYDYDILVQTSFYESFGLTVIEAMKCGLPVVCSKVGGMAEIVEQGRTGFLFENNNGSQLIDILENICQKKYNLKLISENEQRVVSNRFSIQTHKDLLYKIYTQK